MILIRNAVSQTLISLLNGEIDTLWDKRVWCTSQQSWDNSLKEGIFGPVSSSDVSFTHKQKIKKELSEHLPSVDAQFNYHLWHHESGIRFHSDAGYQYGATLYLNEWDKKWGGLFVWEDDGLHCVCPEPGLLVLNTDKQPHHVTNISPQAPYPRRSLQIFAR